MLEALADRDSGFEYIARKVDLADAEQIEQLDLAGIGHAPRQPPHLPAGRARRRR